MAKINETCWWAAKKNQLEGKWIAYIQCDHIGKVCESVKLFTFSTFCQVKKFKKNFIQQEMLFFYVIFNILFIFV